MADEGTAPRETRYAGVVLAAGAARRMGGRPKALLERDGVPLVRRMARVLIEAGVGEIVVVLGHRAEEVGSALDGVPVRRHVHEGYLAGRVSSLRAGLEALTDDAEAVLVALADQPLIETADVFELIDAYERRGDGVRVVVPRVAGVRGHPVVLDAGVRREILRGEPGVGVRQWIQSYPAQVAWFDSGNVVYCVDVDAPGDLERIAQHPGCAMRWPE